MALRDRFQILKGWFTIKCGEGVFPSELSEGKVGAKFIEGVRLSRATMFFCKRVMSVTILLLIIHITMYFLISLSSRILGTKG